jgi:hypothetical protein
VKWFPCWRCLDWVGGSGGHVYKREVRVGFCEGGGGRGGVTKKGQDTQAYSSLCKFEEKKEINAQIRLMR